MIKTSLQQNNFKLQNPTQEAVDIANDCRTGLASYFYSGDVAQCWRVRLQMMELMGKTEMEMKVNCIVLQHNPPGGEGSTDRDGWDQRGDDLGDRGRVWRRQRVRLWSGGLQVRRYESFTDVGEIRVWFASKILTPCRMH